MNTIPVEIVAYCLLSKESILDGDYKMHQLQYVSSPSQRDQVPATESNTKPRGLEDLSECTRAPHYDLLVVTKFSI